MRAWRRPPGYLAFIVLGIVGVVAAPAATAIATSDDPGSRAPLYVGLGAVAVFVVLLLAYQWVGTAMAARDSGEGPPAAGPGDPPADLLVALALEPGSGARSRRARREIIGGAARYQALLSLMALGIVMGGTAYEVLGFDAVWRPFGDERMAFPLAFTPVYVVLAFLLLTLGRRLRWALSVGDELLAPLGLRIAAVPTLVVLPGAGDSTHLAGSSIVAGRRHGRLVEVALSGRHHTVALDGSYPPFTVRGRDDGRLEGTGPVAARVAQITAAERWRGVEVDAGSEGLVVRRSGGGSDDRERWLEDLWLAEECAAAAGI